MNAVILILIVATAIIAATFGEAGWHKTERYLDGSAIAIAVIWIAASGDPHCVEDPGQPWDHPATRHAIDWRAR